MKILDKWMELENIILSEVTQSQNNTQCVLTDKWRLVQKFGIAKIQFTDQTKLKKKEYQSMNTLFLLRSGNKVPWENIRRQSVELRLKERPSRHCYTPGIPYHIHLPCPDTIVDANKCLLTGA